MITKTEAIQARIGDILHHMSETGSDGQPVRIRVNGKCQTWKTRPTHFRLPCRYGLKHGVQVTHDNAKDWTLAGS